MPSLPKRSDPYPQTHEVLNLSIPKAKKVGGGKAGYPRKDKEKEKERRKHDQKASNDIAD